MNIGKSQSGISMIEVMVSVALLGVVTMGVVALGDSVATQGRVNRIGNNIYQVFDGMRAGTLMEEDCVAYLGNANGTTPLRYTPNTANNASGNGLDVSFSIPNARGPGRQVVSAETGNNQMQALGLEVVAMEITSAMSIDDGDPAAPQRYLAFLELELGRMQGGDIILGNRALFKRSVVTAMFIETDAPNANAPGDVTMCRGASTNQDMEQLCIGLGPAWEYDTATEECIPPTPVIECPQDQVLTELSGGVPVCRSIGIDQNQCAPGHFMTVLGIERFECQRPQVVRVAPPVGTACPPQTVEWSVGGNDCSAAIDTPLAQGASRVLSDFAPGTTGTADVSCGAGQSISFNSTTCNPPAIEAGCWGTPVAGAPAADSPNTCDLSEASATCTVGDSSMPLRCLSGGSFNGPYTSNCVSGQPGDPQCVRHQAE